MQPKYSINEIERRWLVPESALPGLLTEPPSRITDKYLHASRLRLRKVESDQDATVFKLCKKYGNQQGPSEAMTNLYLDAAEYEQLDQLPGAIIVKLRYRIGAGSIDVFADHADIPAIFEIEFSDPTQAAAYDPPEFVSQEVTGLETYTGAYLARSHSQ